MSLFCKAHIKVLFLFIYKNYWISLLIDWFSLGWGGRCLVSLCSPSYSQEYEAEWIYFVFFFKKKNCWPLHSMWDLSSPTRHQTHAPALEMPSFNHWTTRILKLNEWHNQWMHEQNKYYSKLLLTLCQFAVFMRAHCVPGSILCPESWNSFSVATIPCASFIQPVYLVGF